MRFGHGICGGNGGYGVGDFYGRYPHMMGMYPILGIIILVIVALLFFYFLHNKKKKSEESEAERILKNRFVNGEITKEEYLNMKKTIQS